MKENRSASNRIGKDLSTHRHYGIDIWFITQSTKLLNDYVLENVGEHVHLYRPNKRKSVQVYWWSYCQKSLTKTAFKDADDKQIWRLNPAMFDYYKSTSQVTDSKARTSQKFVTNMISAILLIAFIAYMGVYKGIGSLTDLKHDTTAKDKTAVTQDTSVLGVSPQIMPTELQQPIQAQEITEIENKRIILDNRKKYLGEYTAEVADDDNIRPALVAKMGNQCKAYNKFGELLYIDDSLCNSMLVEVGVMPRSRQVFNDYLAQSQPPTLETTQPTQTSVQ